MQAGYAVFMKLSFSLKVENLYQPNRNYSLHTYPYNCLAKLKDLSEYFYHLFLTAVGLVI